MSLRARHGKAKRYGVGPVVEQPPADELRPGVPAPEPAATGPVDRRGNGTVTPDGARRLSALAAAAKARRADWHASLAGALRVSAALEPTGEGAPFVVRDELRRFVDEADRAFVAKLDELARDVGGGQLGAGVISLVRTWTWQTYASRALFELGFGSLFTTQDPKRGPTVNAELLAVASRLGDAARSSLLGAHHLARLEAQSRTDRAPVDDAPWLTNGEVDA